MYNPFSSYRIPLSNSFKAGDLERYVDYQSRPGIGSIYASPVCKAVKGSNHEYDETDPQLPVATGYGK